MTLLEADNLTLLKGSSLLLRHYSLTIAAGQIIHLTGDNGSGKTTLLQALAGLITPQGGTIRRHAPHLYLGHRPGIKTTLTARENLRYAARLYHGMHGAELETRLDTALAAVALHAHDDRQGREVLPPSPGEIRPRLHPHGQEDHRSPCDNYPPRDCPRGW